MRVDNEWTEAVVKNSFPYLDVKETFSKKDQHVIQEEIMITTRKDILYRHFVNNKRR